MAEKLQYKTITLGKNVCDTIVYPDGSRYVGETLKGLRHGLGKRSFFGGGHYIGQWSNDLMDGNGILYYSSGKPAYDGEFRNDEFHGKGTVYNEEPLLLETPFDYKDFNKLDKEWFHYQGEFQDSSKSGYGILLLTNGEKHEGFYKDDKAHGQGVYYLKDRSQINGVWVENKFSEK